MNNELNHYMTESEKVYSKRQIQTGHDFGICL